MAHRVAIVGSRSYEAKEHVVKLVNIMADNIPDLVIVSGGAKGPDKWAEETAAERGVPTEIFHALWEKYGKGAGFKRNTDIAKRCDEAACFWDGISRGTEDTMRKLQEFGKPYAIFDPMGQLVFQHYPDFSQPSMAIIRSRNGVG